MKNYRILVPIALALLMIISVFSLNKNNKKIAGRRSGTGNSRSVLFVGREYLCEKKQYE